MFMNISKVAGAGMMLALGLNAGIAQAAGSVIWTSPANGTEFNVGTIVHPTGTASGTGTPGIGLDLMLVLDGSGSMGNANTPTSLAGRQRAAALALVDALPTTNTSVGVVEFRASNQTQLRIGLTQTSNDNTMINNAITAVTGGGLTAIGTGIEVAQAELNANGDPIRSQQMVVISDGGNNSGINPVTAATNANAGTNANGGTTVNTVGFPGSIITQMEAIASAGGGSFTNLAGPNALDDLINIFNGTGGNLVGVDTVDITLPDGTTLLDVGTDGLGNFKLPLPGWAMLLGDNVFTATATFTDGTFANAELTLVGVNPIPLPAAAWMLLSGLAGLGAMSRKRRRA